MSWKKNKYLIIRNAVSKELTNFCKDYFLLKRKVCGKLKETSSISPFNIDWGYWEDKQVPNTYSHYADIAMETLLSKLKPLLEKKLNLKLYENYSYARIYKDRDILEKHKDRFSCEISTTLNLGGDNSWPIYINPDEKEGGWNETTGDYMPSNKKGVKVNLNPGDMLIYRGDLLEHYREPYKGNHCVQVFLHYNNAATEGAEENAYDRRPHLGLPGRFLRAEKKIPK